MHGLRQLRQVHRPIAERQPPGHVHRLAGRGERLVEPARRRQIAPQVGERAREIAQVRLRIAARQGPVEPARLLGRRQRRIRPAGRGQVHRQVVQRHRQRGVVRVVRLGILRACVRVGRQLPVQRRRLLGHSQRVATAARVGEHVRQIAERHRQVVPVHRGLGGGELPVEVHGLPGGGDRHGRLARFAQQHRAVVDGACQTGQVRRVVGGQLLIHRRRLRGGGQRLTGQVRLVESVRQIAECHGQAGAVFAQRRRGRRPPQVVVRQQAPGDRLRHLLPRRGGELPVQADRLAGRLHGGAIVPALVETNGEVAERGGQIRHEQGGVLAAARPGEIPEQRDRLACGL